MIEKFIKELAKLLTRNEFINVCMNSGLCPDDFNLSCFEDFEKCGTDLEFCKICFDSNMKDIKFKDDSKKN